MPTDIDELVEHSDPEGEPGLSKQPSGIVGIGVCAASLRSLATIFSSLGPGANAAYVIAVRQEEGLTVDAVLELLHAHSPLPAKLGENGERLRPGQIYVGAPQDMITIERDHLSVRPADAPVGHRGTIDTLMVSIAQHAHERAVVVVLAGLGSDGAAGVTATKHSGGLSMGEAGAEGGDQPGTAGPIGVVDVHVPAEKISTQIAMYLSNVGRVEEKGDDGIITDHMEAQIGQITTILRNVTSNDFHGYKRGTFVRRVQRRMQVLQVDTLDAYLTRLRNDREEVQHLFQDLLIGVTQFFRDPHEFEVLEREIPRLFEGKGPEDAFRVWVLGCATGEEAYSIAILLREHMATLAQPPAVQIFATDLDSKALELARAGRYSATIVDHVRPDRLDRWFTRQGDTYCVAKELREMCIFSPHNLIKDAPFSRIDLLSCRNLLIYLNAEIQNRVIPIFHFSLNAGGVLFLGSSENVTRHQKLFAPIDRRNRVFRRLETATRIIPDFPLTARARVPEGAGPSPLEFLQAQRLSGLVSRQAEAVADRYAPAYVVLDRQYDVLHFSGRTGRFLEPIPGIATLNLLNLVHRDLRIDLRAALHRAVSDAQRVELHRLVVRQEDQALLVNIVVEPLGADDVTSLVVLFQSAGPAHEGADSGERTDTDEHVQRLEADLRLTRERLQATIEELESTNEELKSSNEEYQSINEELQSANEEMETSKEELQSVNEELQTVNGELAHRVSELSRSNSDLKNLLDATQIATIFLDNDLRVRSFTPSATEIFHLLETDVGRPLGHVVSRVAYPELQDDVRRVLKTLVPVDRSVIDPSDGRHFAARVLPYRSVNNYISGALVTFTDLTAVHKAETALRESEERFRMLVGSWAQAVWEAEADGTVTADSPSWRTQTGQSLDEWLGTGWLDAVHPEDRSDVEAHWTAALAKRHPLDLELRLRRAGDGWSWTNVRIAPLFGEDGAVRKWVAMNIDTTVRHAAEGVVRESEERQAFLLALSDALRAEPTADALAERALRMLSDELGLDLCYVGVYRLEDDWGAFPYQVGNGRTAPVPPGVRLSDFPEALRVSLDRTLAVDDVERHEVFSAMDRRSLKALGFRAFVAAALRHGPGRPLWAIVAASADPRAWTPGEIALIEEVTERTWSAMEHAHTETALSESEERLRIGADVAKFALWDWNVQTDEVSWSDEHFRMQGYAVGEVVPSYEAWAARVHPDDLAGAEAAIAHAREQRTDFVHEFRTRHQDGSIHWVAARGRFFYDDAGDAVRMIGAMLDTTLRRQWENRQQVLVAELQHRTRNIMAVVSSMFERTWRESPDMATLNAKVADRLAALARVQSLLSRLDEGERITFDELIHAELSAMGVIDHDSRVVLDGPSGVLMRSSTVQTFALALHELATNASKYGALAQPNGHLSVTWRVDRSQKPPRLRIEWIETGVQMPSVVPASGGGGYGRELIENALPYQLDAETHFELGDDGVRCVIELPVSAQD